VSLSLCGIFNILAKIAHRILRVVLSQLNQEEKNVVKTALNQWKSGQQFKVEKNIEASYIRQYKLR